MPRTPTTRTEAWPRRCIAQVYAEDAAGNITQIHDAVDNSYNRHFAYDELNRLTAANTGASLWGSGSSQQLCSQAFDRVR